jgi:asparagine synthase (glutamine-hydrolysing)
MDAVLPRRVSIFRLLRRLLPASFRRGRRGGARPAAGSFGFPVVAAAPGPPFAPPPGRRRATGRVTGVLVPGEASATPFPAGAVADHDACFTRDGAPCDLARLAELARAGRLAEVEGAFALAWTEPGGTVCLARDAIGERTLYYAERDGALAFASTIPALLATGVPARRLDTEALLRYLAYAYVPGSRTMVDGVSEVLPGEVVRWRPGSPLARHPYFRLPEEALDDAAVDEEELRAVLRARLELAVRRRLPAPGDPILATVSGGIDSSLVAALARRLHDGPLLTLSVSFGSEHASELPASSLVARHLASDHRIVEIRPAAVAHHLDECVAALSEPIGDPLTIPNALMFREASRHAGVVLNGEGGDPCFGGPKNLPMLLAEIYGDAGAAAGDPAGLDPARSRERSYLRAHQKCYDDLESMLDPTIRHAVEPEALERHLAPHLADPRHARLITRLMAVNLTFKGAHHILPKVDAMSAPFGVLPRSPLFDRGVVDAAFSIPPRLKLAGSVEKYLLKRAVADLLPPAILSRPKSGMLVPVEGWFTGPLLPMARERLLDGLAPRGIFRRRYLEQLLSGRLPGLRPRRGVKIWLLVTLEAWLRTVLDGASVPGHPAPPGPPAPSGRVAGGAPRVITIMDIEGEPP